MLFQAAEAGQRTGREGASVQDRRKTVVKDLEIGRPINSGQRSETAEGVYTRKRRQNSAIASMPSTLTRSARATFWRMPMPSAAPTRGAPGVDRRDFEARRGVRGRPAIAGQNWRSCDSGQENLPTGPYQTREYIT